MKQKDIKNGVRVRFIPQDLEGVVFYHRNYGVLFIADKHQQYFHDSSPPMQDYIMKRSQLFNCSGGFKYRCWYVTPSELEALPVIIDYDEDDSDCI